MLNRWAVAAAVAVMMSVSPKAMSAQETSEPAFHYITVTTFNVPLGQEGSGVMMWVDSVMVPLAKLNSNVLSYHVGRHNWGSSGGQVVIISEYPSWAAIEADCGEPCAQWMQETQPEEGTPRAEQWDKIQATFLKYYTGHSDEIYAVPNSRSK
ncbi:MAG: hypothetical protein JSU87_03185 [Gemmatimonadota bacterium]|nr:MAG: hypothetical protein JSU87_03185 [Gemmatimonadota bacterium]